MSAYIVGKEVIDQIIAVADLTVAEGDHIPIHFGVAEWCAFYGVPIHDGQEDELSYPGDLTPDDLGRLLWVENLKSVADRYPDDHDGDRPGPVGFRDADAGEYVFAPLARIPTVVEGFKLLDGYEYQSCEHPGWATSAACSFITALRRRLIHLLPGYEEAPWV